MAAVCFSKNMVYSMAKMNVLREAPSVASSASDGVESYFKDKIICYCLQTFIRINKYQQVTRLVHT